MMIQNRTRVVLNKVVKPHGAKRYLPLNTIRYPWFKWAIKHQHTLILFFIIWYQSLQRQMSMSSILSTRTNFSSFIKLTRTKFLSWRAHLVPYFERNDLYVFVIGESKCSSKFIFTSANETTSSVQTINLAYTTWYKQDKIILSTIIPTLTEGVLSHVVNLQTSHEV